MRSETRACDWNYWNHFTFIFFLVFFCQMNLISYHLPYLSMLILKVHDFLFSFYHFSFYSFTSLFYVVVYWWVIERAMQTLSLMSMNPILYILSMSGLQCIYSLYIFNLLLRFYSSTFTNDSNQRLIFYERIEWWWWWPLSCHTTGLKSFLNWRNIKSMMFCSSPFPFLTWKSCWF